MPAALYYWLGPLALALFINFFLRRKSAPYPPGPSGPPFLGAALKHPRVEYWRTYALWGKQYSTFTCSIDIGSESVVLTFTLHNCDLVGQDGIISFHVLGRRIVILNTAKIATELLDSNSATYSDRPFPTMSGLLMRREKSIFLMYVSFLRVSRIEMTEQS